MKTVSPWRKPIASRAARWPSPGLAVDVRIAKHPRYAGRPGDENIQPRFAHTSSVIVEWCRTAGAGSSAIISLCDHRHLVRSSGADVAREQTRGRSAGDRSGAVLVGTGRRAQLLGLDCRQLVARADPVAATRSIVPGRSGSWRNLLSVIRRLASHRHANSHAFS